jgi:glycosyltransferase involved in cell wall biosynthesis
MWLPDERFEGRLGVQQRVFPRYRLPFFEALASASQGGLSLFAGQPRPQEAIAVIEAGEIPHGRLRYVEGHNLHFLHGSLYLCYQRGLIAWLEAWQPAALIVEANARYLSTPAAIRWMHRRAGPVIGWGLGAPPPVGWLGKARQRQRVHFLRQFDALIAYSHRGAEEYARLGFPARSIFVAPNAVSPAPQHPLPARPPRFESRPTVLFVGRLQARKRVDHLLYACAALPASLQPRLIIVGDGPARPALEALARQVYPGAEFVGAQYGEALARWFILADLFVLPGTGGLAIQEAMAYGLPVIVAQGDGTQDDLVRPANGWQIPPTDGQALTATLRLALADVARLRAMGAESYRIVREEINLEKMVAVFLQALQALRR